MPEKSVILFKPNEQQINEIKEMMNKTIANDIGKLSVSEAAQKYGTNGGNIARAALTAVAQKAIGQENADIRFDPSVNQMLSAHASNCLIKTINRSPSAATAVKESPIQTAQKLAKEGKYEDAIKTYGEVLRDKGAQETRLKSACAGLNILGTELVSKGEKELAKKAYQIVLDTTTPVTETYRKTAERKIKEV